MATLALTLFGSPAIMLDNQAVHIGRRKAVALLAYLAVTQRHQSRAHLAALLWPEYDEAGARGELRRALSALNRALGVTWLDADRNRVTLNSAADISVDLLSFRQYISQARTEGTNSTEALTAAVALAQDEFLAGFRMDDAPDFEEWQRFEAQSLQRDRIWALAQFSQRLVAQDPAQALRYAQLWLSLDSLDEAAHRRLMELHAAAGDLSAAYRQYQACKHLLAQELGAPPADETNALYEQIRDGHFPTRSLHTPIAASVTTSTIERAQSSMPHVQDLVPNHNLPAQLTPFVGRTHELQQLANLLAKP